MDAFIQDIRFGLRKLLREPRFAAALILIIALGIGTSTAIFTVVNGVLLRPLPLPEPQRVLAVHRMNDRGTDISQPDAIDIRRSARSFAAFGVVAPNWSLDMVAGGEPVHVAGALTESGYFRALGLPSIAGRFLQPADDAAGAPAVAVLSERFWRTRFAADRSVIGRSVMISDVPTTIVGIAPASADVFHAGVEAWVSIAAFAPWAHESRGSNNFSAVARLAPGVSLAAAQEELKVITTRLTAQYPDTNANKILAVTPLGDFLVSEFKRPLLILLGAVLLVLLISTVNVASLLLLRSHGREKEVGVRHALGAGQLRIVRQLITEGILVSSIGGILGVSVAWIGFGMLKQLMPASLPRLEETAPDARVLGFAVVLSLVAGIAFSLAPAWRLRSAGHLAVLGSTRGVLRGSGRRVLAPLIIGEIALALVLLAGAGLLLRSFSRLVQLPLGFDPARVAAADVVLPESRYADPARQTAAFTRMVEELRGKPGVIDAAFVVGRPQSQAVIGHAVAIEGRTYGPGEQHGARYRPYIGNVFRVFGMRFLRGRAPIERAGGVREVAVNERFAEFHLAGKDPIGTRFALRGDPTAPPAWLTIVGVVENVKSGALREGDASAVYAPYVQREDEWIRFGGLVAKVSGSPAAYRQRFQDSVTAVDALVPIESFATMDEEVDKVLAPDRFSLQLVSLFGIIALILSMQGIFSVVGYDVEQRRAELSLRMALGARPADVLTLVLRRGTLYMLSGIAIGGVGALALARILQSVLFETSTGDPVAFGGAAALLAVVCAAAVILAASRAMRIHPASALAE